LFFCFVFWFLRFCGYPTTPPPHPPTLYRTTNISSLPPLSLAPPFFLLLFFRSFPITFVFTQQIERAHSSLILRLLVPIGVVVHTSRHPSSFLGNLAFVPHVKTCKKKYPYCSHPTPPLGVSCSINLGIFLDSPFPLEIFLVSLLDEGLSSHSCRSDQFFANLVFLFLISSSFALSPAQAHRFFPSLQKEGINTGFRTTPHFALPDGMSDLGCRAFRFSGLLLKPVPGTSKPPPALDRLPIPFYYPHCPPLPPPYPALPPLPCWMGTETV